MNTRQLNKKKMKKFINENGFFYTAEMTLFKDAPSEQSPNIPEGATYFECIVSDGELNRNGYKIRPKALMDSWQTYKTNPVILLGHDPNQPVGQALNASLLSADGKGGVKLAGYIFDDLTEGRFSRNLLRGFSTGTIIEAVEFENTTTGEVISEEDFRKFNWEEQYSGDWIMVAIAVDWVESSAVSLPSNKKALLTKKDAIELYLKEELNEDGARLKNNETENEKTEEDPKDPEEKKEPEKETEVETEKPASEVEADDKTEKTEEVESKEGEGSETAGEKPADSEKPVEKTEAAEEETKPTEEKTDDKILISIADRAKLEAASNLLLKTLEATMAESEEKKKDEEKAESESEKTEEEKPADGEKPKAEGESEDEKSKTDASTEGEEKKDEKATLEVAPQIKAALVELVSINQTLEKENADLKDKLSKVPNRKGLTINSQFNSDTKAKKPEAGAMVLELLKNAGFAV